MSIGHRFRVLRLSALSDPGAEPQDSTWPLEQFKRPRAGVNVFYLPGPYLRNLENRPTLRDLRRKLGLGAEDAADRSLPMNRDWWTREGDFAPRSGEILALYDLAGPLSREHPPEQMRKSRFPTKVEQAVGAIHTALRNGEFDKEKGPLIVFAHASVRDAIYKASSVMAPSAAAPGEEEGSFYEYLIWDEGGLWNWNRPRPAKKKRLERAWYGTGWPRLRIEQTGGGAIRFSQQIEDWMTAALDDLSGYDLSSLPDETDPDMGARYIRDGYLGELCQFLPDFLHDAKKGIYRGAHPMTGESGGPRRISSLADLGYPQRQLLLDGWLTPWRHERDGVNHWTIQPGSLALLYWAARELNFPYSLLEPEAFLARYRWSGKGWFGGYL